MYRYIVKPILFLFPPEVIHLLLTGFLSFIFKIPGITAITRAIYYKKHPLLETDFLGMKFANPVGLAAGFDKNGEVFNQFSDFGFSHVEVGTVTPLGQPGNEKPRSFRIPKDKGLINRMGFNNKGVDAMVLKLSHKRRQGLIIGGNIGKNTVTDNSDALNDYDACFSALYGYVDYFVVNVSCPNISNMEALQDQEGLEAILSRLAGVRKSKDNYTPILLKISPDLNNSQIDTSIEIVKKYGIDGIVATNTTIRRDGLKTGEERIGRIGKGGMSGAPVTARSLEVVRYITKNSSGSIPIIGVGGIMTVEDALNMLDAGASLIQVYTGFIYNGPGFVKRINSAVLKRRMSGK